MSKGLRRAIGALELLALAGAFSVFVRLAPPPQPAQSGPSLSGAVITGYVLDAATGKPVRDAQVSTIPATETVVTNSQGLYALTLGASFGTVTVLADARRYRQVRATCVAVKAGLNTLGDVTLLHEDEDVDAECPKACGDGEECRLGHCVPSCAPACECTQMCEAGACVPNPNVPGEDSCGHNATWLGGGLCACKPGYVPSVQGRNCVSATETTNCPENAFPIASGCACSQGYVPNVDGNQCITIAEAAVPAALGDGNIVATWALPMAMPRSLAVVGDAIWTINLETESLTKLTLGAEGEVSVAAEVPLGGDAWRISDLAATADQVFLARRGLVEQIPTSTPRRHVSSLMIVDAQTLTVKHFAGNNMGDISGIAVGEESLLTVEFDNFHQRSFANGSEVGVPLRRVIGASPNDYLLLKVPGPAPGIALPWGLSYTRSQLIAFLGTSYDGASFLARFEVLNSAGTDTAYGLRELSLPIPGSHLAGFDFTGAGGWVIVGGSGLQQPVLGKVAFDGAL